MKKLRIIAFILTCFFIMTMFISCNTQKSGDTKTSETTRADVAEGNTDEEDSRGSPYYTW